LKFRKIHKRIHQVIKSALTSALSSPLHVASPDCANLNSASLLPPARNGKLKFEIRKLLFSTVFILIKIAALVQQVVKARGGKKEADIPFSYTKHRNRSSFDVA